MGDSSVPPLIGITPSPTHDVLQHGSFDRYAMAANYVNAIAASGGAPVIFPPQEETIHALLDAVSGLLLSGGGDVAPHLYGDAVIHPATYGVSAQRDAFELALIERALERDMPILGICRGAQILNVALGGTLFQDVESQCPSALEHRQHTVGLDSKAIGHSVSLLPGSLVQTTYGEDQLGVNSFHHQAIRSLAPGLVAAAWSKDGLVEAIVAPNQRFVVGVQWHPEIMFESHPIQRKLFHALVAAADEYRGAPLECNRSSLP